MVTSINGHLKSGTGINILELFRGFSRAGLNNIIKVVRGLTDNKSFKMAVYNIIKVSI